MQTVRPVDRDLDLLRGRVVAHIFSAEAVAHEHFCPSGALAPEMRNSAAQRLLFAKRILPTERLLGGTSYPDVQRMTTACEAVQ